MVKLFLIKQAKLLILNYEKTDIYFYFYGNGSEKNKLSKSVKLQNLNNVVIKDYVSAKNIIEIALINLK